MLRVILFFSSDFKLLTAFCVVYHNFLTIKAITIYFAIDLEVRAGNKIDEYIIKTSDRLKRRPKQRNRSIFDNLSFSRRWKTLASLWQTYVHASNENGRGVADAGRMTIVHSNTPQSSMYTGVVTHLPI